jgi:capsular polysaccharide biosynthesis protein
MPHESRKSAWNPLSPFSLRDISIALIVGVAFMILLNLLRL